MKTRENRINGDNMGDHNNDGDDNRWRQWWDTTMEMTNGDNDKRQQHQQI